MQACEPTFLSSIERTSMERITVLPDSPMMPSTIAISAPTVNHSTSLEWSTRQRRQNIRRMQPRGPACPLKAECTPSPYGRQVHRSFHVDYLERVKGYYQTEAYQKALRKRKVWVEPLFGEAKEWHGMRRFRLRRLWRVNGFALVIAAGQNLKRLLKKRGWGRRPFPAEAVATMPPDSEPDEAPRHGLLKSYRPSVAVASVVIRLALSTFFEPQISLFSLIISNHISFSYNSILCCKNSIFSIYSSFTFLSLSWRTLEPSNSCIL